MRCAELAKDLRGRAASLDDSIRAASADTERALLLEQERVLPPSEHSDQHFRRRALVILSSTDLCHALE